MGIESIELAPNFRIPRILKGAWQIAQGHGSVPLQDPIEDMFRFAEAGVFAFDCGDVYAGVEDLIGQFIEARRQRLGDASDIKVLTKFIPDFDALPTVDKSYVQRVVDQSLRRLRLERLDVLQFFWWSYDVPGYIDAVHWVDELRQAGKIHKIGLVNIDVKRSIEIMESGIDVTTAQVPYSVLDNRTERGVAQLCEKHGIGLLCYATVTGGFLSEKWLGAEEPAMPLENRSLDKYKLVIDEIGGWTLFQEMLATLKRIAEKHDVSITNVATRYVLERPQVASIILGARNVDHLKDSLRMFSFELDDEDYAAIRSVQSRLTGPVGDVYEMERDVNGPHWQRMNINLHSKLSENL